MSNKYFGTDGIRGRANQFPMTAEIMMKTAMAAALAIKDEKGKETQKRVIIGKDTRLSCYMLEQAIGSGFAAMGMEVFFTGPMPTPAIAMLTRSMRADIGVMISASHNPFEDNGVKFFGSDGYKLSDDLQDMIEQKLEEDLSAYLPAPDQVGKAKRIDDAPGRYIEYIKSSFPKRKTLEGLKIAIDCANGAAYKIAPTILWELEAEVVPIGVHPNGKNINDKCGATDTRALEAAVIEHGCDIGVALDGDADRLIMVDEKGLQIDGDQIMGLLAKTLKDQGKLHGNTLVATVMSNLGLERFLLENDMQMMRTPVGDRHVVEAMKSGGYTLGGEQSGHIIMGNYTTTGDGLLSAIHVLMMLQDSGKPASELLNCFTPAPQILKNIDIARGSNVMDMPEITNAIGKAEQILAEKGGRLLVRPSGTQPMIRVMAEGDDLHAIESIVDELCSIITKNAA